MNPCVYMIYSEQLDTYYIGETSDLNNRIEEHKNNFYKNSFTSRANDWKLFYKIDCETKKQAIRIEKHIKNMKSNVYIHNLKNFPDIAAKLKDKYIH